MKIEIQVKSLRERMFKHLDDALKLEFEAAGVNVKQLRPNLNYKTIQNTYRNKPVGMTVNLDEFVEGEMYQLSFQNEKYKNILRVSVADCENGGSIVTYEELILDALSHQTYLNFVSKIVAVIKKRGIRKKIRAIDLYLINQEEKGNEENSISM